MIGLLLVLAKKKRKRKFKLISLIYRNEVRKSKNLKHFCRYLQLIDIILEGIYNKKYHSKREIFYSFNDIFDCMESLNYPLKQLSFLL